MADATAVLGSYWVGGKQRTLFVRYDGGVDNAANTVSLVAGKPKRIILITTTYSGAVTKTATVTLNAGLGAGYDTLLNTISLSAVVSGFWQPPAELWIGKDDILDVVAAASGAGGTTNSTAIYYEEDTGI